jgi:hypothetical protein
MGFVHVDAGNLLIPFIIHPFIYQAPITPTLSGLSGRRSSCVLQMKSEGPKMDRRLLCAPPALAVLFAKGVAAMPAPAQANPAASTSVSDMMNSIPIAAFPVATLTLIGVKIAVAPKAATAGEWNSKTTPTPAAPADASGLPPGWQQATDPSSGKQYYYKAGVTQWEPPK